jgi:4-amino-4-deoxy-L-arabinose transferase
VFKLKNIPPSILLLSVIIVGFILRLYFVQVDPFLHNWDEHFHALVGKNLLSNPLKPMLLTHPVVPYQIASWSSNHVWLHKQPLFLWQIAMSIKVLGNTVLAVRFPSVLMSTISIALVYRITQLFTKNNYTALIASLLMCFWNYQFNLISGRASTDHNDVAFGFYVLCSIWAYIEYLEKPNWSWIVLIGIFVGAAILNKWLTGLLVYAAWGINALFFYLKKKKLDQFKYLFISFSIAVIVFLPWQLFIAQFYTVEWAHESEFNRRHLWEAMDGNGGGIFFYLRKFKLYYGYIIGPLFIYGLYLFYKKNFGERKIGNTLIILYTIIFIFFSLIVVTKMRAFVYCVLPIGIIFASISIEEIKNKIHNKVLYSLILLIVFFDFFNPIELATYARKNTGYTQKINHTSIIKKTLTVLPKEYTTILNVGNDEHLDLMYYSNHPITAYQGVFSKNEMDSLAKINKPIAVFKSHGKWDLPQYVLDYPKLYVIPYQLVD